MVLCGEMGLLFSRLGEICCELYCLLVWCSCDLAVSESNPKPNDTRSDERRLAGRTVYITSLDVWSILHIQVEVMQFLLIHLYLSIYRVWRKELSDH